MSIEIFYGGNKIQDGQKIDISKVRLAPKVKISGTGDNYYAIIAVDPDAPYPEKNIYKYWLHWIILNNDEEVIAYNPPDPPIDSDYHKYYFILLK